MTEGFGPRRFLAPRHDASHAIRVPRVRISPSASFRSHLTMGTLAVRLGVPVIKASKGLAPSRHFPVGFRLPVDSARQGAARHAWRTSSSPGGLLPRGPHQNRPSRLLKNTRIGLFSWPSCVSRPPRQRCARGHAVPTRGPATPAAGDQGHLASRFRNRTKLSAVAAKVSCQSTRAMPRCRSLRRPPTVFIQPKTCSTSFRFR